MTTVADLVAELALINHQLDALNERKDEIKAELRGLVTIDEANTSADLETDSGTVTVSLNRRLDVRKVMASYPVSQYPQYYRPTPNSAALKDGLPLVAYEALMSVVGAPKVVLR